jgi:hypothetical protein
MVYFTYQIISYYNIPGILNENLCKIFNLIMVVKVHYIYYNYIMYKFNIIYKKYKKNFQKFFAKVTFGHL